MILEVKDFSFKYSSSKENVLKNIKFSLAEGEFLAITGRNNSGKSTLGYAINGLIPHFYRGELEGSIVVNGKDTVNTPIGELVQDVGLVFQNPFTQLSGTTQTVFQELAIGLENFGVPKDEMVERINNVMKILDIEFLKDRVPFGLSGGQQQKVALASILVMEPKVLILDEPTSQLDPGSSEEIFQIISILKERGTTIILIEHKLEEIAEYADRVMVLEYGEIKMLDKPEKVLNSEKLYELGIRPTRYAELGNKLISHNCWKKQAPVTFKETKEMVEEIIND